MKTAKTGFIIIIQTTHINHTDDNLFVKKVLLEIQITLLLSLVVGSNHCIFNWFLAFINIYIRTFTPTLSSNSNLWSTILNT